MSECISEVANITHSGHDVIKTEDYHNVFVLGQDVLVILMLLFLLLKDSQG